jgi:hypothetical protein
MMSEEYMAVKIFNEVWMEVGHKEKSRRLAIMQVDRTIDLAPFRRGYGIVPDQYTKEYWLKVRGEICNIS